MEQRKSRGPSPIDQLIQNFVRENGLRSGGGYAAVFKAWTAALDEGFRAHARPVRFRSGELCIDVDSSAHMQELKNFTGETIRKRANERLGKETIRRVVFKLQG